jgi:hypothetical protein
MTSPRLLSRLTWSRRNYLQSPRIVAARLSRLKSKARPAERHPGILWKPQRFVQLRIVKNVPEMIDDLAISPKLIRKHKGCHALRPVGETLPPLADLPPASIGLQKMETTAESARRVVINVTNNVRGELSAHVITVSELNRKKIACAIECDGHDAKSVGIIDTIDVVRRDHFALPHGGEGHFQPSSENKKRAISHSQMLSTINSTNPIPTSSTASATESYSSQCR